MQDKQKVTLYIPPELHRQLKIRSAVDTESMSDIAQRALSFYLDHADVVAEVESGHQGNSRRVYACPSCSTSVVLKSDELIKLDAQPAILSDTGLSLPPSQLNTALSARS